MESGSKEMAFGEILGGGSEDLVFPMCFFVDLCVEIDVCGFQMFGVGLKF